ncbi:integrase core domain-containing protein [Streptomyces sp. NPDC001156]
MLLRLAYLAVTHTFALLRLLPMSDRDKDVEILALRRQLLVLQRQVGKPTFTDTDRAVLAGLLHHLPMDKLRHLLLLVRPDTLLRWHRDLLKRRIRIPRMNSLMERSIQTCRRELLDRTLIWNQSHLLHSLNEFETFYNCHRTHRALGQAAPLRPLPAPINVPKQIGHFEVRRRDRLGGTLHEYQHACRVPEVTYSL